MIYLFISILLHTEPPNITDWITAAGVVLGVPAALYGIFRLFMRDKQRDTEIASLVAMVRLLQDQTFTIQTQTTLIAEDLKLNRTVVAAENKPFLKIDDPKIIRNDAFVLTLKNHGKKAYFINFENEHNMHHFDWDTRVEYPASIIETGGKFQIVARYRPYREKMDAEGTGLENVERIQSWFPAFSEKFHFDVIFKDAVGNQYRQRVIGNENSYTPFVLDSMHAYWATDRNADDGA